MPFRSFDLRLPHIRLAAIEIGQGPLALLCHGITANAHVFEPLMELLAGQFRCVSLDQRGHGASDKPIDGYSAEHYADDIGLTVRELAAGPAIVIGHSLGARNALVAGVKHRNEVRAVIAIEFVPFIETAVFIALDSRVAGGEQLFASNDAVRQYLASRYVNLPPDAIERRARFGYEFARDGIRTLGFRPRADARAMACTSTGLREDLAPFVESIDVPTLLIRGADSKLVSREAWMRTRALRPDLQQVELADADHYAPEEVPRAVAATVLEFWKSIEVDGSR
ncbi:MAG: alpha/beta hydrolase [Burkholderiales bacterium]